MEENKPRVELSCVWSFYDVPLSGLGRCSEGQCYFTVEDEGGWDDYSNLPQAVKDMVLADIDATKGCSSYHLYEYFLGKCKYYISCHDCEALFNSSDEITILYGRKYSISFQKDPTYFFYLLPPNIHTFEQVTEFMLGNPKPLGVYASGEIAYYNERRKCYGRGS